MRGRVLLYRDPVAGREGGMRVAPHELHQAVLERALGFQLGDFSVLTLAERPQERRRVLLEVLTR